MIKIINCGIGNYASVKNMINYLGHDSEIINRPEELNDATGIIFPGVGSFDNCVKSLKPFLDILNIKVKQEKIPFLGICVGMQLLFSNSEEGVLKGLDWISGTIVRFDFSKINEVNQIKIPHMGWNEIEIIKKNILLPDIFSKNRFYFIHSYHADRVPDENILALCNYGYNFVCAVQKENIFGLQFHPEKSHKFGMKLMSQFLKYCQC
jgi:glutamine amidotransferase